MNDAEMWRRRLLDLASDEPSIFKSAESWFLEQGPAGFPTLEAGLQEDDLGSVAHWRILRILQQFADVQTLPAILQALNHALDRRDMTVILGAVEALSMFRTSDAADALIGLLDQNNKDIVKHAAAATGNTGDARAITPLLHLLNDPDPSVRYSAARGLTRLDDPMARIGLEKHLKDETDSGVRELILSEGIKTSRQDNS